MNTLTNEISRLSEEIAGLRSQRAAMLNALVQERHNLRDLIMEKRGAIQEALAETTERTKSELEEFVGGIKERVTDIRQKVNDLRQDIQADMAGARSRWNSGAGNGSARSEQAPSSPQETSEAAPKTRRKKH